MLKLESFSSEQSLISVKFNVLIIGTLPTMTWGDSLLVCETDDIINCRQYLSFNLLALSLSTIKQATVLGGQVLIIVVKNSLPTINQFIYIYIYIYIFFFKIRRSTKRFIFLNLSLLFLHMCYIYVCFQLIDFVRECMWHKTMLMGYTMKLELTYYIYLYIIHNIYIYIYIYIYI